MIRPLASLLTAAALWAAAGPTFAQDPGDCAASMSLASVSVSYDALAPGDVIKDVYLQKSFDCPDMDGTPLFTVRTGGGYGPDYPAYVSFPGLASGEVLLSKLTQVELTPTADVAAKQTLAIHMRLRIPKTAGMVDNSFQIRIIDYPVYRKVRSVPTPQSQVERYLTVDVDVGQAMQLSVAGGATTLTMDFGTLTTGESKSVNLIARSTVPFRIRMDSEMDGQLKLNGQMAQSWAVPYSASLGGTPIAEGDDYAASGAGGTSGLDLNLPFEVTIGDAERKRAGTYRDVVTLKIEPY